MSQGSQGSRAYKNASITTASREQILIMLYEAAIRHVKKASEAIEKNKIKEKCESIGKAHDIINELVATLDHKIGGALAADLERLYNFIIEQLVMANLENSVSRLQSCEKVLGTLLEGWKGALEKIKSGNARE
jgi:flagellar protein FliS